ncbi:MAG: DUF4870 domain-containing protein [Planctomycetaceae bacterium]|nr:DUF4870 domain-containing protein [Planctomycetaceae bacterium]
MLIHLSQLLSFSGLGVIVPIVLWAIQKDNEPLVDRHGKIVLNWMISMIIYLAVSAVLIVILVGFVALVILGVLAIVFPIIGGVKANSGIEWQYPLSIKFFNVV